MAQAPPRPSGPDFRPLRVVARVKESETITSFVLEPVEAAGWRSFEAGQFLVVRLPSGKGQPAPLRHYSVSSAPGGPPRYRVTVKREPAPHRAGGAGLGSGYFHDEIRVGDEVLAEGPRGAFTLDRSSRRPVVLLSGGVGLTPLVAMLHALAAESGRTVHFIHACDNGGLHALRDEVEAVAAARPGVHVHFCYRAPTGRDVAAARHHSAGVVTRGLIQRLLPLDDYDVYLCGPTPFMRAVHAILRSLGVPKNRIAYEFFGPASLLDDEDAPSPPPPAAAAVATPETSPDALVRFARSGISAAWTGASPSLLDLAEAQGLRPEFSCRAGICGTCSARLLSGDVEYFEEPLDPPPDGQVLLCCARPAGSVSIDI